MQAIGIHGAFASAEKIAFRCRLEDAGGPVVADRQDKLDRWHAARHCNSLNAKDAADSLGVANSSDLVAQLDTGVIIVDLSSALRQLPFRGMNVFSNSGGCAISLPARTLHPRRKQPAGCAVQNQVPSEARRALLTEM